MARSEHVGEPRSVADLPAPLEEDRSVIPFEGLIHNSLPVAVCAGCGHQSALISVSAFSSQWRMLIARYIVAAVVK